MSNFKTPEHEILFRCHKIGLIAGGLVRHGLTEKQKQELDKLRKLNSEPELLTEKQLKDLALYNSKYQDGSITSAQLDKRNQLIKKQTTPKGLTDSQEARLIDLEKRLSAPPELSEGAKTHIKEVWLKNEKGFSEEVTDKKLRKGIQAEEDAITLISVCDQKMYVKNEDRKTTGHLTGECDIIHYNDDIDCYIIDDLKCSWSPRTFMAASMTTIYEWQGRAYLYLYDADIFRLRHCLVDCPPDVLADEYKRFCFQHNIIDDTLEEYQSLIEQFNRNYLYENSGLYTKNERVKTFMLERDYELEKIMLQAIDLAVEYYKTITLNMI